MTLSSDSEPLQHSSPSWEDKTDQREGFINESSQVSEEEKALVPVKNETESPKKRKEVKVTTPYKRRKTANKNKEGKSVANSLFCCFMMSHIFLVSSIEDRVTNKVATGTASKKATKSQVRS